MWRYLNPAVTGLHKVLHRLDPGPCKSGPGWRVPGRRGGQARRNLFPGITGLLFKELVIVKILVTHTKVKSSLRNSDWFTAKKCF